MLIDTGLEVCGGSVGGIRKILLTDYYNWGGYLLNTDGQITQFIGDPEWVVFDFDSKLTEFSESTGLLQSLNVIVQKIEYTKRVILKNLYDRRVMCVFLDNNGVYTFFGENGIKTLQKEIKITPTDNRYLLNLQTRGFVSARQILTEYAKTL